MVASSVCSAWTTRCSVPSATFDVISGHVVFDYDVSRELAGALEIGAKVSPFAMI